MAAPFARWSTLLEPTWIGRSVLRPYADAGLGVPTVVGVVVKVRYNERKCCAAPKLIYNHIIYNVYIAVKLFFRYNIINMRLRMTRKDTTMRMKAKTIRAINMLAGEIQIETGENVSADDAVWAFIQEHRPDIAEKAEKTAEQNGDDTIEQEDE